MDCCLIAAVLHLRGSCVPALCKPSISCAKGSGSRADSNTVTAASCHGWPEQRAIDQHSCLTRCHFPAVSGQSDGSAGTELIESPFYRHSPETEFGQSNSCLWHRSVAFALRYLFPRICLKVISNWHIAN